MFEQEPHTMEQQVDSQHSQLEVEEGNKTALPAATTKTLHGLSLENKRLKLLVILFAILSLFATAGLIAGVVIAVRQTRKATKITQQEPPTPENIITTIYYFNDDEEPSPPSTPLPGNGIVDPIPVDSSINNNNNNDAIALDEDGSFVITAEDLATQPPQPIIDRIPVNEENEESPNDTVVITIDPFDP